MGQSLDDYIDPRHPLQAAIRRDVALATGMQIRKVSGLMVGKRTAVFRLQPGA